MLTLYTAVGILRFQDSIKEHKTPTVINNRQEYGLTEEELQILNGIVSGYFDFAEVQAMRHRPMHMSDYVEHLDRVLSSTGEQLLVGAGKVSHKQAMEKANQEYQRFLVQNLSPVEEAYLQTIKEVEKTAKKKAKED